MVREWIIFAICLGLGGHIALGLILHAPDLWSWQNAGSRGLLIGLAVYVTVQVIRSIWWVVKGRGKAGTAA
ncbi:MAG: hypothetical protein KGO52_15655 [Nitrospirota bacterium]|nr:hypothetical protein [Nitrospirota bacterium]MDE3035076.1 hypothetical protein [Nitrospirota bacterium]MDE3117805.1 hypothetical protein [Nitrospirota bacterium]MDE3226790.1 hypothetical protein [Nitrospirota bacterium]MDE3244145.1 hypothetical protein [Nitrospirota bacterium]